MSLLIKALASAEKDKQAEFNKKSSVDASSVLELAPLGVAVSIKDEAPQPIVDNVTDGSKAKPVESSTLNLAPDTFGDNRLSLEEEAGLSAPNAANNLYAKPKANTNKAKIKESGSKSQPQSVAAGLAADSVAPAASLASHAAPVTNNHQKVAASVFVANQAVKTPSSKSTLVALGIAGALMIWLGLQGYQYIRALSVPEIVVVNPAPPAPHAVDMPINVSSAESGAALAIDQDATADKNLTIATVETAQTQHQNTPQADVVRPVETEAVFSVSDHAIIAVRTRAKKMPNQPSKSTEQSNNSYADNADDEAQLQGSLKSGTHRAPMKLVSRTPAAGVDPTLLAAYQAFSRGEDASAQQQYRQVLQRDVRNVDALLGMAAIAQRQGRDADAMGWYQKVLEIEPRNTIAQSAVVSLQVNADVIGSESRIKNMLAQQPESANLHAALGNLYAEQNQWALAQAAYFNASRFAPNSADYAFNVAISLDQLGKSNLALAQYQRALELLNSSGGASPDRAQLEARINALR
jgi:tetratricopeptide (TPR) repeat protein